MSSGCPSGSHLPDTPHTPRNLTLERVRNSDLIADSSKSTSTPPRAAMSTSSEHTHDNIRAHVIEDLRTSSTTVARLTWLQAVLGLDADTLRSWATLIGAASWFDDPQIRPNLVKFCKATTETGRYQPFSDVTNRILELGKDIFFFGRPYPVQDIKFVRNDPILLQRNGKLDAGRKPDVLCIRSKDEEHLAKKKGKTTVGLPWTSVLAFAEFKVKTLLVQSRRLPEVSPSNKRKLRDEMDEEDREAQARPPAKKLKSSEPLVAADAGIAMDVKYQAASYALEILSSTRGTRLYSLGMVFMDDGFTLWYYDSSGIVRTEEELSFIDDFETFAAIVVALGRGDPYQWGALPSVFRPPGGKEYPVSFPPESLKGYSLDVTMDNQDAPKDPESQSPGATEDDQDTPKDLEGHPLDVAKDKQNIRLTLENLLFAQYSIVGRRTFVYEVAPDNAAAFGGRKVVAKFSQQVATRTSEAVLLKKATDAGVAHLPEMHLVKDLWKLSDGLREIFFPGKQDVYEDRIHRMIVYMQYSPLETLFSKSSEHLPTMVDQMLDCLQDLKDKAGIIHRDVSVNNIMWELRDGKPFFILNDFDLVSAGLRSAHSSKYRTGTLPFISLDMLEDLALSYGKKDNLAVPDKKEQTDFKIPVVHRLRHDFESLLWVALWCGMAMEPVGGPAAQQELLAWEVGTFRNVASHKTSLVMRSSVYIPNLPFTPKYAHLASWYVRWMEVFKKGYDQLGEFRKYLPYVEDPAKVMQSLDLEYLASTVTKKSIKSALAGHIQLPDYMIV